MHVQRDIDYTGSTAQDGDLKTDAADRYVPVPDELRTMLTKAWSLPDQYVFHNDRFEPLSQNSFRRIWWSLMQDAGCVVERAVSEDTSRPTDILKRLKPTLTPHYFRHNYVTLLYESGVDPLVAMKIVGHRDYQTTANIYTHLKEDSIKKAAADMATVFKKKKDAKQVKKAFVSGYSWDGVR